MHKTFYASGFLYHLPSEQILLQQQPSTSTVTSPWSLFSKSHTENEEAEVIFKNIISDLLGINIDTVQTVYSYLNEEKNIYQSIIYSELNELKTFPPKNGVTYKWFSFKDVIKLRIPEQTKHDLVVSKRVIDATARKSRGEFTSKS